MKHILKELPDAVTRQKVALLLNNNLKLYSKHWPTVNFFGLLHTFIHVHELSTLHLSHHTCAKHTSWLLSASLLSGRLLDHNGKCVSSIFPKNTATHCQFEN